MARLHRPFAGLAGVIIFCVCFFASAQGQEASRRTLKYVPADDPNIQYMGRIDFNDRKLPRFWQPGVSITVRFAVGTLRLLVNDEILWGKNHNYYELVV